MRLVLTVVAQIRPSVVIFVFIYDFLWNKGAARSMCEASSWDGEGEGGGGWIS